MRLSIASLLLLTAAPFAAAEEGKPFGTIASVHPFNCVGSSQFVALPLIRWEQLPRKFSIESLTNRQALLSSAIQALWILHSPLSAQV